MPPEDKSKIEELKKTLYSRNAPEIRARKRLQFSKEDIADIKTDWEHPNEENGIEEEKEISLNNKYKDNSMSFLTKILIGSILFFVVAIGMGAYIVLNGVNVISANNIDISVSGPVTIAAGDPISLNIQVNNKNNIKLETVDLDVEFPAGTVDPSDTSKEMKEFRELMNDIAPGGIGQKTVNAVIYGEENTRKEILINVTYNVKGSNAIFKKQKSYDILISSSPISLSISSYKEIVSGQEFTFDVKLSSNSNEAIRNLLLKASFPFGFTVTSPDVILMGNIAIWRIGDIPSKGEKVISFKGKLEGQDDETRIFNFTLGAESVRIANTIGTEYVSAIQEVSIKKPFITASIILDEDTSGSEYLGIFNTPIRTRVSWFNNLPTAIADGEIRLKLSGNAFDKVSVSPEQGLYRSVDNEIVWNRITTPELASIGPGETGNVYFSFTPRDFSTPSRLITNPSIALTLNISGKRVSESNVPENIVSSSNRSVIISSNISLSSILTRSAPPWSNTGPVPPQAEKNTTYTVTWTVDNTSSTVQGAEVRSSLPAYVRWTGLISPTNEDIKYSSNDGQIVWKVGNVDTYTSPSSRRKQVSFQISFEPSVADIGKSPILVNESALIAKDQFTNKALSDRTDSLTTSFINDSSFRSGDDIVVNSINN